MVPSYGATVPFPGRCKRIDTDSGLRVPRKKQSPGLPRSPMAALRWLAATGKGKEGLIVYYGGRLRSRAGWCEAILLLLIGAGALGVALGVAAAPSNPN